MHADVRRCQRSISALPAISLMNLIIVSVFTSQETDGFLRVTRPCCSFIVSADGLEWAQFAAVMQLFLVKSADSFFQINVILTRSSAYAVAQRSILLG